MSEQEPDDFLSGIDDLGAVMAELRVADVAPSSSLRQRVLETASKGGRFLRFSERVADLLDVSVDAANQCLERIDRSSEWKPSQLPDVSLIDLEGGPRVRGAIRGFVRMPAGSRFPVHEHVGAETVLVIQGGFRDSETGAVHRPGAVVRMEPKSVHEFSVAPGPDLVYLVVVQDGIRIGSTFLGPDDPNL